MHRSLKSRFEVRRLCRPVSAAPRAKIRKSASACEHVVIRRGERRLLRVGQLAAHYSDNSGIGPVVPPSEHRPTRVAMIEVTVFGLQFVASVPVTNVGT